MRPPHSPLSRQITRHRPTPERRGLAGSIGAALRDENAEGVGGAFDASRVLHMDVRLEFSEPEYFNKELV